VVVYALHTVERLCGLTGLPRPCSRCAQALLDAGFTVPKRACVADEHYVPTLLAVHGLDNQARAAARALGASWARPRVPAPPSLFASQLPQMGEQTKACPPLLLLALTQGRRGRPYRAAAAR